MRAKSVKVGEWLYRGDNVREKGSSQEPSR